jgi:hypothetical protein
MDAAVLDRLPFSFHEQEFERLTHIDLSAPSFRATEGLIEKALSVARPKAMYKVCYIDERSDEAVELEGIRFTSKVLRGNLEEVERVFPYIVTCGVELDSVGVSENDLVGRFLLDGLKEMALRQATEYFRAHIAETYGLDADKMSTMNPGSGNRDVWPIGQQRQLFQLLGDVEASVGVRLTDSFLMTPNKTVSGILFPTDVPFISCQLCTREDCPRRRAEYTGALGLSGH